ncbi:hypothetical protein A3761_08640 [Oleiphilus sp. HI0123]|nr:hypothetical protein A3761_08640 [Oleiphilus sp. HI0123]
MKLTEKHKQIAAFICLCAACFLVPVAVNIKIVHPGLITTLSTAWEMTQINFLGGVVFGVFFLVVLSIFMLVVNGIFSSIRFLAGYGSESFYEFIWRITRSRFNF